MNNKFLPGAVLFTITFVLSSLAWSKVTAHNTFYGDGAGNNTTSGLDDSGFGASALFSNNEAAATRPSVKRRSTTTRRVTNTATGYLGNTTGYFNTATESRSTPTPPAAPIPPAVLTRS